MERSGSFRRIDNTDTENLTRPGGGRAETVRKRSLVRPERRRLDPDHPQFHYHTASQLPGVNVYPSSTGHDPHAQTIPPIPEDATYNGDIEEGGGLAHTTSFRSTRDLHRDASRRTLRTGPEPNAPTEAQVVADDDNEAANTGADDAFDFAAMEVTAPYMPKEKGISLWAAYCKTLTCFIRPWMMKPFGMKTPERQMAWREKIGLISVILLVGTFVGYLTFGFTESVCNNNQVRIHFSSIPNNNLVVSGAVYDVGQYYHPSVLGFQSSVILYPPVNAGGKDASFMFQNVNGNCLDLITPKDDSSIPHDGNKVAWYFPCQIINPNNMTLVPTASILQDNNTKVYNGWGCHTHNSARDVLYNSRNHTADVYYTWDDLNSTDSNLVVYNGDVLNLDYLGLLYSDDLDYPRQFDELRNDNSIRGQDITQRMAHGADRKVAMCLREIAKVGVIDTEPIGCIASKVVLYVSLVFIVGLVALKFVLACYFRFFIARRQGASEMTNKEFLEREQQIEDWGENIYSPGPYTEPVGIKERRSGIMEKLTQPKGAAAEAKTAKRITMSVQNPSMSTSKVVPGGSIYSQPLFRQSAMYPSSAMSFNNDSPLMAANTAYRGAEPEAISLNDMAPPYPPRQDTGTPTSFAYSEPFGNDRAVGPVGGDEEYLVPQPPVDYQPFGFPLAHAMCLVTAYSESVEGLRTTLDSIATTDYPNSHKLITIICDGLIKGSGNDMSTPEICLSMMTDFAEEPDQVGAYSYVSVVSGAKRHNMAKVYAGFYKYDNSTVPIEKQQRVPVICIVKCGTPEEAGAAKPGNRGKRDSQIILMSFLQRIMFDERMTELEFEIFNGIRSVTGIAPDFYEVMLMVDADTKVYPDSITHMIGEMVRDPLIIGLCGETKIANKRDTWVTAIQVFEYFISHHQAKAFESVFGNVTCLPGCFSMYRIKAPKGMDGYWLPILCNPDIVERYADNVIDTLHKKNLLLLGEDRYLSTLMLRTFPSRKMVFVPKAACKTIVPDKFKVLLSQRRRWINSTIHNLMELVLVRDLCGVFIISMQFVVFIDLVSTLVLPAAISFTIYIIIIAIVKKPTPVLSLVLLALILGLPGLLIVVTASRASYILWMLIYLMALPVWNFVLPMYAYWKFDDFSWGETRTIEGGDKGGHDEVNGEFDASHIQMKRWREFQETRATQAYDPYGTGAKSSLDTYSQLDTTPSGTPSLRSS
ncbi:Chitin synthase 3 [Wickerhamiella sorbophila]|uniref:chitin synthase n=1 Tax=Wickerhamiella sorbophila TaxID=45607 RepID=A0A2T0FMK0_9ASCO|nr:Chitin synthase 3 [Wickerhamiella sorbophila]PRT56197.1 Chitin synthase 3 [Wickerhamiella sorbophila]